MRKVNSSVLTLPPSNAGKNCNRSTVTAFLGLVLPPNIPTPTGDSSVAAVGAADSAGVAVVALPNNDDDAELVLLVPNKDEPEVVVLVPNIDDDGAACPNGLGV